LFVSLFVVAFVCLYVYSIVIIICLFVVCMSVFAFVRSKKTIVTTCRPIFLNWDLRVREAKPHCDIKMRKTERDRQREIERQTGRQTDREKQREKQTESQKDRSKEKKTAGQFKLKKAQNCSMTLSCP